MEVARDLVEVVNQYPAIRLDNVSMDLPVTEHPKPATEEHFKSGHFG